MKAGIPDGRRWVADSSAKWVSGTNKCRRQRPALVPLMERAAGREDQSQSIKPAGRKRRAGGNLAFSLAPVYRRY